MKNVKKILAMFLFLITMQSYGKREYVTGYNSLRFPHGRPPGYCNAEESSSEKTPYGFIPSCKAWRNDNNIAVALGAAEFGCDCSDRDAERERQKPLKAAGDAKKAEDAFNQAGKDAVDKKLYTGIFVSSGKISDQPGAGGMPIPIKEEDIKFYAPGNPKALCKVSPAKEEIVNNKDNQYWYVKKTYTYDCSGIENPSGILYGTISNFSLGESKVFAFPMGHEIVLEGNKAGDIGIWDIWDGSGKPVFCVCDTSKVCSGDCGKYVTPKKK